MYWRYGSYSSRAGLIRNLLRIFLCQMFANGERVLHRI